MANSNKNVVATFTDRYGEERQIHHTRHGLTVKRETTTPILKLNRHIAGLIGVRIRTLRLERGLELAELALMAGLVSATPKSRMWEIENSVRKEGIRLGTLYALAFALEVPVTELLPSVEEVAALAKMERVETPSLNVGG